MKSILSKVAIVAFAGLFSASVLADDSSTMKSGADATKAKTTCPCKEGSKHYKHCVKMKKNKAACATDTSTTAPTTGGDTGTSQ